MFFQPGSVQEALELKQRFGSQAAFLAGGTDLMVLLNRGLSPAKIYIDLTHVEGLDKLDLPSSSSPPSQQEAVFHVGAACTFSRLATLPVSALAQAARSLGGPQVRNRATIAGNLATASPAGDGSTALLALNARVELESLSRGHRQVALCDFFLGYKETALAPDELILSISFPQPRFSGWQKLGRRGAVNMSLVSCAVGLLPSQEFRVAFGSVGPFPLRAPQTEAFLQSALDHNPEGRPSLPPGAIEEAEHLASAEVAPIDDFRASAAYRRAMSGVLLRKVLRELFLDSSCPKEHILLSDV